MMYWWVALGAEMQAAAVGAVATVVSTFVGVLLVRAQIRSSAQQSRDSTAREHRETIRIELYRDVAGRVAKAQECGSASKAGSRLVMLRYSKAVSKGGKGGRDRRRSEPPINLR